jgi:hypothetical protein
MKFNKEDKDKAVHAAFNNNQLALFRATFA